MSPLGEASAALTTYLPHTSPYTPDVTVPTAHYFSRKLLPTGHHYHSLGSDADSSDASDAIPDLGTYGTINAVTDAVAKNAD